MDQLRTTARRRRLRLRARRDGFTLLEVMIALGVLAVGLLGIAAMQLHALKGGRSGKHTSDAAALARAQVESFKRLDFDDPQLADTAGLWTAGPQLTRSVQSDGGAVVEQAYNIQWRVADLNAGPTLKAIDVIVSWNEPDRPNRTVTLSTVRYDD